MVRTGLWNPNPPKATESQIRHAKATGAAHQLTPLSQVSNKKMSAGYRGGKVGGIAGLFGGKKRSPLGSARATGSPPVGVGVAGRGRGYMGGRTNVPSPAVANRGRANVLSQVSPAANRGRAAIAPSTIAPRVAPRVAPAVAPAVAPRSAPVPAQISPRVVPRATTVAPRSAPVPQRQMTGRSSGLPASPVLSSIRGRQY